AGFLEGCNLICCEGRGIPVDRNDRVAGREQQCRCGPFGKESAGSRPLPDQVVEGLPAPVGGEAFPGDDPCPCRFGKLLADDERAVPGMIRGYHTVSLMSLTPEDPIPNSYTSPNGMSSSREPRPYAKTPFPSIVMLAGKFLSSKMLSTSWTSGVTSPLLPANCRDNRKKSLASVGSLTGNAEDTRAICSGEPRTDGVWIGPKDTAQSVSGMSNFRSISASMPGPLRTTLPPPWQAATSPRP